MFECLELDTASARPVWSCPRVICRESAVSPTPRRPGDPAEIIASERMVKEQQMRWTPRGARLLLQVRTQVLNDQLASGFRR
jgi:UDP-glucose 4-epimerase